MKVLKLLLVLLAGLGAVGFIYMGVYPIGADVPHTRPVYWLLETVRERSIAARIGGIDAPPLDDPQMLLAGGADYNDMCAGCHLKPGRTESDMSIGLYPKPPNLAQAADAHGDSHEHDDARASAARQFWIIKHGIKASAMPAWGPTHDDARIWAMVAFLQKLPTLTPAQYQILTARGDGGMEHDESSAGEGSEHHD
ncbi:MAG: cytochrome c [Sinimarinibacterium sp.]|jgi:mono/diheme cytochrome c family protein